MSKCNYLLEDFKKLNREVRKMENIYYIVWNNYDSTFIERFNDEQLLENRYAEIKQKEHNLFDSYGTKVDVVICGKEIDFEEVRVVNKYKIKKEK